MSRRPVRPLLALAVAGGACLIAAAPALAGPKHAAQAALKSLDATPHRSVETTTFALSLRGAGKLGKDFPNTVSRTVAVRAVESAKRDVVTFTAAPDALRGVRVVTYDGQVYLSRQGGPFQRAGGQLKRFLTGADVDESGDLAIDGAEVLAPVTRNGVRLRHLRVRLATAQELAAARAGVASAGIPKALAGKIAGAFRIQRSDADIYVDATTGLLSEVTTRFAMTADMNAVAKAIDPKGDPITGVMVVHGSSTTRITAVGAVTVEQPSATDTVSSLEYLGMPAVEPAAKGPVGNADGIALARRVNDAYRRVPGLVLRTRRGRDVEVVTVGLTAGRLRTTHTVAVSGGKRGEWIGLAAASYSRDPGARCWSKDDPGADHPPAIAVNGSRFYAPVTHGAVVRLRVLAAVPGAGGEYAVYTIDRRTGRIVSEQTGGMTIRWQALTRAPKITAPAPVCAAA